MLVPWCPVSHLSGRTLPSERARDGKAFQRYTCGWTRPNIGTRDAVAGALAGKKHRRELIGGWAKYVGHRRRVGRSNFHRLPTFRRSRHLPVASTDGSLTENPNEIGVRLRAASTRVS